MPDVIDLLYGYAVHVLAPGYVGLRMAVRAANQTNAASTFHLQNTVSRSDSDHGHGLHLNVRYDRRRADLVRCGANVSTAVIRRDVRQSEQSTGKLFNVGSEWSTVLTRPVQLGHRETGLCPTLKISRTTENHRLNVLRIQLQDRNLASCEMNEKTIFSSFFCTQ